VASVCLQQILDKGLKSLCIFSMLICKVVQLGSRSLFQMRHLKIYNFDRSQFYDSEVDCTLSLSVSFADDAMSVNIKKNFFKCWP